jgi:hypothetical protein
MVGSCEEAVVCGYRINLWACLCLRVHQRDADSTGEKRDSTRRIGRIALRHMGLSATM